MKQKIVIAGILLALVGSWYPTQIAQAAVKDVVPQWELSVLNREASDRLKNVKSEYYLKNGDEIKVTIWLLNPSAQNLVSAQTWLTYDATRFTGRRIDFSESDFDLQTPGEDKFVPKQNLVRLGRGSTQDGGVTKTKVKMADIYFKVNSSKSGKAYFNWYDFQTSELGHTSVNIMEEGLPVNLIGQTPKRLNLVLNGVAKVTTANNGNNSTTTNGGLTVDTSGISAEDLANYDKTNYGTTHESAGNSLLPPTAIRVVTGRNQIHLRWSKNPLSEGTYVYYTQHPQQYLHRKKVVGEDFTFDNLKEGDIYYFSLSAFTDSVESYYSPEIRVEVGNDDSTVFHALPPESVTSLDNVPNNPQSGTSFWLYLPLIFLGTLVGWRFYYVKKK